MAGGIIEIFINKCLLSLFTFIFIQIDNKISCKFINNNMFKIDLVYEYIINVS